MRGPHRCPACGVRLPVSGSRCPTCGHLQSKVVVVEVGTQRPSNPTRSSHRISVPGNHAGTLLVFALGGLLGSVGTVAAIDRGSAALPPNSPAPAVTWRSPGCEEGRTSSTGSQSDDPGYGDGYGSGRSRRDTISVASCE